MLTIKKMDNQHSRWIAFRCDVRGLLSVVRLDDAIETLTRSGLPFDELNACLCAENSIPFVVVLNERVEYKFVRIPS